MRFLFAILFCLFCSRAQAEVTAKRTGGKIRIEIDGKLFTEYRSDQRIAFLFPMMAADGTHLTRRYPIEKGIEGEPTDHPHHVSFWVAHGSVNGNDFWHDPKTAIRTKQLGEPKSENPDSVSFTAELEWIGKTDKRVLSETRTYRISSENGDRVIDIKCDFKATDGDVFFGDTKEGAFAIRVAPTLQMTGEEGRGGITNSDGEKGNEAWGRRAKWVASHGPNLAGNNTVIALMDHPRNLNFPTWWHARDYGLFAANPFGTHSFRDKDPSLPKGYTLKEGESLVQRYRFVIHSGDLPSANLDARWETFSKSE